MNGGLYGVIKMKANENISNLTCYEPQIPPENDHVIAASFIWLNSNENCQELFDDNAAKCHANDGFLGVSPGSSQLYPNYVYSAGVDPFRFAIQSWCWIQCKFSVSAEEQYYVSQVGYNVEFDESGPWANENFTRTFLINGVAQPTLVITVGEWQRFRIVNTNMAYLIWQLNDYGVIDSSTASAITIDVCEQQLIGLDGIYFSDGPRLLDDPPYSGSVVIPPGGRADMMMRCFENGTFSVIASNNTRNTLFTNAPVPNWVTVIMDIYVEDNFNDTIDDYDPGECQSLQECLDESDPPVGSGLPCHFVPYLPWSPYLAPTENLTYPDVTSSCQTVHNNNPDKMTQCNIVLGHTVSGGAGAFPVSVNHIVFEATKPLLNISTNITHEWLVTSNFHEFHQHIWPFQLQTDVVDGWLAKTGEWRDTVGAPGSYIARSNFFGVDETGTEYYSDFFRGKLIQHCHFVPHEDHGLMAYHELQEPPINFDNDSIIPNSTSDNDYNTSYSTPDKSKWVKDCVKFSGITSVIIEDSKTVLVVYFKQFKKDGYCFFGYLPVKCSHFCFFWNFFVCNFRWCSVRCKTFTTQNVNVSTDCNIS